MQNILFLSFWTPPIIRPQSILVSKMLPYWRNYGLNPIVLTYQESGVWKTDFDVHKIRKVRGSVANLRGQIMRSVFLRIAFRKAKKLCIQHNIKAIFSFSNPQESNVLGAMLSKELNLPFISHFSDPYLSNAYKSHNLRALKFITKEEALIISRSTSVIVTNQNAKELISTPYKTQQAKFKVVEHCFEPALYPEIDPQNEKFTISHIGAFYKQRSPEPFFEILKIFLTLRPDLTKRINIKFIGGANPYAGYTENELKKLIEFHHLEDLITLMSPITFEESLKEMKKSDCLLAIDANTSPSPFLPSKLVDYLGAQRAILAITPSDSPTHLALKKCEIPTFNYDQLNQAAGYLKDLMEGKLSKTDWSLTKGYQAQETQRELCNIILATIKRT